METRATTSDTATSRLPGVGSAPPLRIRRTRYDPSAWGRIVEAHPDREIFHTPEWLEYLRVTQGADPIIGAMFDGERQVGYLVGAIVRRFGLRILGSPLKGWGTDVMGFLLDEGVDRGRAVAALPPFAYDDLGCVHIELGDRFTVGTDFDDSRFVARASDSVVVDVSGSDEEILSHMRSRTRTYVRRADRTGLRIKEAHGVGFADEYYDQLLDVFTSSALTPTYGIDRVRTLIELIEPTGNLLMMRALDEDGAPVGTTLTLGMNGRAILWGLAHYRSSRGLHAIEPLQFETMRAWRGRGVTRYDLAGVDAAKSKFGGTVETLVRSHHSRYPMLELGRSAVRTVYYGRQKVTGRIAARRRSGDGDNSSSAAD